MMNLVWWWCVVSAWRVAGRVSATVFPVAGAAYDVETTLVLGALGGAEEKHRTVGYRLRAGLALHAAWAHPARHHLLLACRLQSPELELRGAHRRAEYVRRASDWDALGDSTFYAEWVRGAVPRAYLDPAEPPDVLHYKRALLSLLQFQLTEGERNETDVSGDCHVAYETISPTVFRKIKRRCAWEAADGEAGARARRVSRYTLSAERDAVRALHAEEVVWVAASQGEGEDAVGVKARSWTTLAWRAPSPAPAPPAAGSLEEALAALPAHLVPATLPLPPPPPLSAEEEEEPLEQALREARAALGGEAAGAGGGARAAAALPALLRALRRADAPRLRALLSRADLPYDLGGLWHAVGLAGTAAGAAAARALLAPHADDALREPAERYLAGLALCDAPQEEAVRAALALAREARVAAVGEAAWLAAAAAAGRHADGGALQADTRDALAAALVRCADVECRAARVRALGNLRSPRAAEALAAAALHRAGEEAAEALRALRRLPPRALPPVRLDALAALAGNESRALAERALALEVVAHAACGPLAGDAVPLRLVRVARALRAERGADAHELRRALWQRVDSLADRAAVRALRRLMPPDLATWDARAHDGKSSVLRRDTGWEWGGARAQLDSVQVASRGLLRRGAVALLAHAGAAEVDLLTVEVATSGLEALAGGSEAEAEGSGAGEAPAAALHVSVAGAALPPVRLFSGQAELVGHVWAGRGAAPTPAARALLAPAGGAWRGAVPLQAGAALRAEAERAAALALDASADVSLWYRTARGRLALRTAGAARAAGRVRTAWSALRAEARASAEPRLRIAADLDFYDAVALCVRAHLDDYDLTRETSLESRGGARQLHVKRERTETLRRAGRTLALGRENDAACRVLRAADPPEDGER